MRASIRQNFEHLHTAHGNTTDLDLQQNEEKMKQTWNQKQPIESVFQKLEEVIEHA